MRSDADAVPAVASALASLRGGIRRVKRSSRILASGQRGELLLEVGEELLAAGHHRAHLADGDRCG